MVEQEFRLLQKIHHPSLIPLIAFKWEMLEEEECFRIYIAEQLVSGLSLNFYINVSQLTHLSILLTKLLYAI